jgi:3-hydroxyacyl-[acyl-carrier-protein] dehydratase
MDLEYFRLIDRIASLDLAARTIAADANVPATSKIFEGHFPGLPLMPGVLLMETMAQTSGWLILSVTKFTAMPLLAAFKEAKLRSFVTPGTELSVRATLEHEGSGFAVTRAEVRRSDRLVCNAEITFRMVPYPNEEFLSSLKSYARTIQLPVEPPANG